MGGTKACGRAYDRRCASGEHDVFILPVLTQPLLSPDTRYNSSVFVDGGGYTSRRCRRSNLDTPTDVQSLIEPGIAFGFMVDTRDACGGYQLVDLGHWGEISRS